jgi:hypothetical protein
MSRTVSPNCVIWAIPRAFHPVPRYGAESAIRSAGMVQGCSAGPGGDTGVSDAAGEGLLPEYGVSPRAQSGYSSLRQERGSAGWAFGVRSSRELK